jgi:hypothetical protein
VLVGGMPGAGKSTLLARLVTGPDAVVLDSQDTRAGLAPLARAGVPYRVLRPFVHLLHRATVVAAAVSGPRHVVVHLPATSPRVRGAVRGLARATGRDPHLVWLDVTPDDALRGQRDRGRTIRSGAFTRHADAARGVGEALRAGTSGERWASVLVLDRAEARHGLRLRSRAK